MIIKIRKIHFLLILFFFSLILNFSCNSKPIPIPGDNGEVIQDIYNAYLVFGDEYFKLENYPQAIKYYKLSMQNKKLYWISYYKLAKSYVLSSDWVNALPMYEKMLKRDPQNDSLKASVAYIQAMMGDLKKAQEIYKELLVIQSDNKEYKENYLAILLSEEKFFNENKTEFDQLFELYKTDYPDDKNVEKFNTKYKTYVKDEETKEEDKNLTEKEEKPENETENPKIDENTEKENLE